MLDGWGTISIEYRGYQRDGSKFALIDLGGGGGPPASSDETAYWSGSSVPIDEQMDKLSFTLDASPLDLFDLSYTIALERFRNEAPDLMFGPNGDASDPGSGNGSSGSQRARGPLFYIPDTTLQSQSFRVSRNFSGRLLLAAGYSHARLSTDGTFPGSSDGSDGGYQDWNGRIITDNAFLNGDWAVSPTLGLEGFVKYQHRDNDSTLPTTDVSLGAGTALYINALDSLEYGVSGNWRPNGMRSTLTLGWQRTDRERDLLFPSDPGAGSNAVYQGLYPESTLMDEIFLRWVARPDDGWTVRLRPSYTWADTTGFVTEPEEAFELQTAVSYADPEGWMISGFYDYRNQKNDLKRLSDEDGSVSLSQDLDTTLHSAGVSLNFAPRDDLNTFLNLFWIQNDLSSYLLTTARLPSSPAQASELSDNPSYNIDTYGVGVGGDWYVSDKLRLSGSYSYSRSKGAAENTVARGGEDPVNVIGDIDNQLHSFVLGGEYEINPNVSLRANYSFDYYDDDVHGALTDGVHALAVGVTVEF